MSHPPRDDSGRAESHLDSTVQSTAAQSTTSPGVRAPYCRPELRAHGSVSVVTLTGSPAPLPPGGGGTFG